MFRLNIIVCLLFVAFFSGVDTQRLTFHRCRAVSPIGQYFTMNRCSAGQVMNILTAEAGYSVLYTPSANTPQCPWRNCTASIINKPAITQCRGRRSCNISQTILNYLGDSALCSLQKDANFIDIKYTCVTGVVATFHRCRALDLHGQVFTMNECPAGQFLNILTAEVGYSALYILRGETRECPMRNCTASITDTAAIRQCHGRPSCSISQTILLYPPGSPLCSLHGDANFISITYSCVDVIYATTAITFSQTTVYSTMSSFSVNIATSTHPSSSTADDVTLHEYCGGSLSSAAVAGIAIGTFISGAVLYSVISIVIYRRCYVQKKKRSDGDRDASGQPTDRDVSVVSNEIQLNDSNNNNDVNSGNYQQVSAVSNDRHNYAQLDNTARR